MSESARDGSYQDLVGNIHEYAQPTILYGTAGWDGEPVVEDLGSTSNDGRTLARVTLYKGKQVGIDPKAALASGHRVLVQVMGPLFAIPPAGTQVMLAFPDGDMQTPGNGAILGWLQSSPTQQFSAATAVMDMGASMKLVIKAQAVTLMDHQGDAAGTFGCWLSIGPVGTNGASTIYMTDGAGGVLTLGSNAWGVAVGDGAGGVGGALQLGGPNATTKGIGLIYNAATGGMLQLDQTGKWTMGGMAFAAQTGTVSLGALATPMQTALYGPTGLAAIPSTSVFISA